MSGRLAPTGERLVDPAEIPAWLRPLAEAAVRVRGDELSRSLPPEDGSGRESAVLVLLGEDARGPTVLVTERAPTLSSHAGQPSFPGGRVDPGDDGAVGAALREAEEETGLDPAGVVPFATLPRLFLPVNSSVVTPVLAWWRDPTTVRVVDPGEVASVHVVAVAELVDPANRLRVGYPGRWIGPAFTAAGLLVWGFTAGILDRVLSLGGFERPWDRSRVEPLPEQVVSLAARDRASAEATYARLGRPPTPPPGEQAPPAPGGAT